MASELTTKSDWVAKLGHRGRLWVVPEFKLVFVSVAKNACTSIKWVLADLAREDTSKFRSGLKAYTDDSAAVHNRRLHPNIPFPDKIDPALSAEIHPDNGWFVFGVIRDPRSRLFSAWQDKVLLQYPAYRRWASEPWYAPRPGEDAQAINAQFAEFVDAALTMKRFPPRENTHFRSQVDGLDLGRIPYTKIYPIEQLGDLRTDLSRHVEALGWTEPISFRRSNETPLRANAACFAGDVKAKVEQWYADDFAEFGEHFDFARIEKVPEWTAAELREVQVRTALHRRLGDVRQIALNQRKRAEEAEKKLKKATGKPVGKKAPAKKTAAGAKKKPAKAPATTADRLRSNGKRIARGLRRRVRQAQQRRAR